MRISPLPADFRNRAQNVFRVLLAHPLDAEAEARLEAAAQVIRAPRGDEDTLIGLIGDCHGVVARTHTPLTRRVIETGRHLRVIGVAGVGLDRVDLEAAAERGVRVLHTPGAASDSVAELAVGLMIQLLRPIRAAQLGYRRGAFVEARAAALGHELRERTVGILGMGRIGSRVARICSAGFGARVLYRDIVEVGPFPFACESVELETLLRDSDVLTLHVPLTSTTRHMIDAAALRKMRRAAILINTARGAVIETDALVDALRGGALAGAALDVTDPEPLPIEHALFTLESALILPHMAARTPGGLRRMYAVVDDVLAELARSDAG